MHPKAFPRFRFRAALAALIVLPFAACAGGDMADDGADMDDDRAAYLTLLGNDTLAVEWFEFGENSVTAQALVRGSSTTWSEFSLAWNDAGEITEWSSMTYAGDPAATEPMRSDRVVMGEDGMELVRMRNGEEQTGEFSAEAGQVPFVDMLHWTFETAFRRQAAAGSLGQNVPVLGGREFAVEDNGDGTWSLIHWSRGPSTFEMNDQGHITALDGTGSTRAYDLRRMAHSALDQNAFRTMFADRPLGELSGRGEVDATVLGVNFTGDFGTPVRRGREIFGRLVAYGERWRTGANRATHLSFDGDIVIDGVTVPAGDYTLYSIPEADGGTLIINSRTGQTGTSYSEDMDQARVEMRRDALDENVEVFDIRVVPSDEGGRIELRWAETVYYVPFTVG